MQRHEQPSDGALPFSDVTGLLAAAAGAEKQQALVARIFVPPPSDPATSTSVDQFALLTNLAKQIEGCIQEHTRIDGQSYIWHREPPSISVVSPTLIKQASSSRRTSQSPPHILFHLRTGGECIEDEWFATHLLINASAHFGQHQLCISIEDEDGQFLLIEAADYLPEWVTPETVPNRVWIFEGHLHLIPPQHNSSDDGSLSVSQAVELVRDASTLTRASDDIEAAAFARAYEFPSASIPHHHLTLAYLPRRIAKALAAEPQLIANCVTAIQSRDVVSSRSGSRLVHFPPPPQSTSASASDGQSEQENDDDVVLASVRMTRHLYAQMLYDRFFPPRQLGRHWQAAVEKYRLRLHQRQNASSAQVRIEDEAEVQAEMKQGKWHDIGAKIWCGMEMAYTESQARRTKTRSRPMGLSEPDVSVTERKRLVTALDRLGYFQGEIEGSAKWQKLEADAVARYLKSGSNGASNSAEAVEEGALLCDVLDRTLQQADIHPTILARDATPKAIKEAEDDDSWLQLNPDDIESILQSKAGTTDTGPRAINEQDTFQRLGAFNSKMEDFVKTKSDVRGAVFEDELDADDMLLDDDDLLFEDVDEEEQAERIRSEVQERMRSEGDVEKQKLVERLIPRMSEQEWIRKPHPNSTTSPEGKEKEDDFLSSIDRITAERNTSAPRHPRQEIRDVATREDNNLSAAHAELRRRLASQYMRETSSLLSSQGHQQFDGASDSDDEELEQETSPEVRRQRAEEYDIEPDEVAPSGDAAEWEDVGEPGELDEETEVDNLLEFARISLGLTKEQYQQIIQERQKSGKFVPSATPKKHAQTASPKKDPQTKSNPAAEPAKLDTFESVMAAMESELTHLQSDTAVPPSSSSIPAPNPPSAPQTTTVRDKEDEELLAHLLRSNSDLPSSLLSHLGETGQAEQMEAFLRSFQAQTGGPGPVDSLMRRFGLGGLPADQDAPQ